MSGALVDTMAEGRIQKALSGFYYVDTGAEVLTCRARGKFRKEGLSPLVGDRVTVRELGNGEGFVESILPRKNAFERPAVANIDQLVVIGSAAIPKTDPFLIDRIAAIAALKGCEVVVLLNKCDLDPAEELYRIYTAAGFPTLRISAETGEGLEKLIPLIAGKLSAFTGNSGVGKSSILNALDPAFQLKTGEISTALGRGRHTTRHVELFRLSCGAEIMDSPGFSSFETEELNLELDAQHVDLTYFNYLEDDPIVIADAEQIKRVINNIVSNSIKYMDKSHKVINIRLRDVGDFVQVEIEDNGKGIATKDLTKIFDRFYRTDASRNSTRGGSGIGLSIVKKILEDHGGKVWATSKEGVGTTMYFVLRKYQEVPVEDE